MELALKSLLLLLSLTWSIWLLMVIGKLNLGLENRPIDGRGDGRPAGRRRPWIEIAQQRWRHTSARRVHLQSGNVVFQINERLIELDRFLFVDIDHHLLKLIGQSIGLKRRKSIDNAQWFRSNKNPDASTGPLAHLFARLSLSFLAPPCLLC